MWTQFRQSVKDELAYAVRNGITAVEGFNNPGLGENCIHFNANGGAQAINLAYLLGASTIVLYGFDMQNTGGKSHWFGDHPPGLATQNDYRLYIKPFNQLAIELKQKGVVVLNATRETALDQFERVDIEQALQA